MPYTIQIADYDTEWSKIRSVRKSVFIDEQGIPADLEWDADDQTALFVLATDDAGNPVGTGRLLADGKIGRMAVLSPWRNQGIGKAMLKLLIDCARKNGLQSVYLNAQTSACAFYHNNGFIDDGAEHIEAGIPHQKMFLNL